MEDYNEYIELQSNMFQYYNDINASHINISNINTNEQQIMNTTNDNDISNNDISIDTTNNDDIIDTSMLKPICENDLDYTNCVKSNNHNDINTSVYHYKDYK